MSTGNTLARQARATASEYSQLPVLASPQHTRPSFCTLPDDAGERVGGGAIPALGHATNKQRDLFHARLTQPRHVIGRGPGAGSSEVGLDVVPRTNEACFQCRYKRIFAYLH
jgi:hypothetical protein